MRDAEAEALNRGEAEFEGVPHALPVPIGVTVEDKLADEHDDALRERVPESVVDKDTVGDGVDDSESEARVLCDALTEPVLETLRSAEGLSLRVRAAEPDSDAESLGDKEGVTLTDRLVLGVPQRVAEGELLDDAHGDALRVRWPVGDATDTLGVLVTESHSEPRALLLELDVPDSEAVDDALVEGVGVEDSLVEAAEESDAVALCGFDGEILALRDPVGV